MGFNLQDYEPVEDRLRRFWSDYPEGRVETRLIRATDDQFIVKSFIYKNYSDEKPWATGYAEERVDPNPKRVNFASALENCETSSLGRCLANAGYSTKGKRPSREEMGKVQRATAVTAKLSPQQTVLKAALTERFPEDPMERKAYMESVLEREVRGYDDVLPEEVGVLINSLATEAAN